MEQPFELKQPGPQLTELAQAEELIRRLTHLANVRRQKRPILEAWSFRIEKRLHDDLKKASRRLDPLAMSDIVNGLLDVFLPAILAQRTKPDSMLSDPAQREVLAGLLKQLSGLLQTPQA